MFNCFVYSLNQVRTYMRIIKQRVRGQIHITKKTFYQRQSLLHNTTDFEYIRNIN